MALRRAALGTLADAATAFAPTLPPEHRPSLATVFRALPEALSGGVAPPLGATRSLSEEPATLSASMGGRSGS